MSWDEVGDRCYRRRYESLDLNVGVVLGAAGALLIDTRSGCREAAELRADLRALGVTEPRWVVNTHGHYDHCFGNARFRAAELWGQRGLPPYLDRYVARMRAELAAQGPDWAAEMAGLEIVPPDHLVADRAELDLGDRVVELRFLGRGHTDHDLVVLVPDASVVYAGDLVEESAPPAYGDDSYPLDWPATDAALLALVGADATVVPGHGDVVGRDFVVTQHARLRAVAEQIRGLHAAGVPLADALAAGDWSYPPEALRHAVARGYAQLDAQRR